MDDVSTTEQVAAVTTEQVAAVTTEQVAAVTTEQVAAVVKAPRVVTPEMVTQAAIKNGMSQEEVDERLNRMFDTLGL